jgi:trk system potassium uptake protein
VKAVIVGCGRVGAAVAHALVAADWEVTVVDESEDALARLGPRWSGPFILGHGMDSSVLRSAGAEEADAVVVATNGDNTNIVVAQLAQHEFGVERVIVRLLDPARAEFYRRRGMRVVCPTESAIREVAGAVLGAEVPA